MLRAILGRMRRLGRAIDTEQPAGRRRPGGGALRSGALLAIGATLTLAPGLAPGIQSGCAGDCALADGDVEGSSTSPYGTAYPTGDFGFRARQGTVAGQLVPNLAFHGYPGSGAAAGLQTVSIADFYDPEARNHRVLLLSVVVMWCSHCVAETEELAAAAAVLRSEGAEILQVAIEGPDTGVAPDRCDLEAWKEQNATTFTVAVDGLARRLSAYTAITTIPYNALVDARTMEVLDVTEGQITDVAAYVRAGLDWVDSHPL